jgi:uroporphyrinogen-III synthase
MRAPALAITHLRADADMSGVQGVLFTSSNGVHAFAAASAARDAAAWCVGEATAAAARDAGFAEIHAAAGDVARLADLVAAQADPAAGLLVHAAGADLAGDLAGALRAHGFTVDVRTFYRADPMAALPAEVEQALAASPPLIDAVMFHSARGAHAFLACVQQHESLARIDALCLSSAVAEAVRGLTWRRVAVAREPLDSALLELLRAAE